ncbi:MAG: polyhydroxyalkanoate synthesis repressor PhaR, partial [Paracoccaceae bacterium]|nr:polyhydroxyalkanoate synthesis repressor PhaR [Paracoccaceae bacterium]
LRDSQSKMMENLTVIPNPLSTIPGMDAMRKQQEAFLKSVMGGMPGWGGSGPATEADDKDSAAEDELAQIKKQLADLQKKLSKL